MHNDWYELFSRGSRDWLRHNDKVREAVRQHLPDAITAPDLITGGGKQGFQVPVKLLEHARFRLSGEHSTTGAGQGPGEPGDLLHSPYFDDGDNGAGSEDSAVTLMLEFSIDEVMDWLWHDLQLPELQPRGQASLDQNELVREGWDKRGARSRLDRRRTVKEAVKRRAIQTAPAPFTNDDLRFRQLAPQPRPRCNAVVFFVLDVSSSMSVNERRLAKTFFFLALHGLRRQYQRIETRFLAHAAQAWEFEERVFFAASGMGGTLASSAFQLVKELLLRRYPPATWNSYLFYASDGDNFSEDRSSASKSLGTLAKAMNFLAYVETLPGMSRLHETEMSRLWNERIREGLPMSVATLSGEDDVYTALRQFLSQQVPA